MWILGTVRRRRLRGGSSGIWRWWTSRVARSWNFRRSRMPRRKYLTYVDQVPTATPTATWTRAAFTWRSLALMRALGAGQAPGPRGRNRIRGARARPRGRAWPMSCRPAKSPVLRVMTSRGNPHGALSPMCEPLAVEAVSSTGSVSCPRRPRGCRDSRRSLAGCSRVAPAMRSGKKGGWPAPATCRACRSTRRSCVAHRLRYLWPSSASDRRHRDLRVGEARPSTATSSTTSRRP